MPQSDTYTAAEFAEALWKRGYGGKKQAQKWLIENGITTANEEDFMHCYHDMEDRKVTKHDRRCVALCVDGQNLVSPGKFRNSYGKSFAAEMAREAYELDKLNRRIRQRYEEASQCT